MNTEEQELADEIYSQIQRYTLDSPRSQQAKEFRVGVSDLGYCSERLLRMLKGEVPEDKDMLPAFIGTALGEYVERAVVGHDGVYAQQTVEVELEGDNGTYVLTGHPDLIYKDRRLVLDVKSSRGLQVVERLGPRQSQRWQRTMYGYGAWRAGWFGDCAIDDVKVGNVWIDRAADDRRLHVNVEPLRMEDVYEATAWLEEVIYSYVNGTEARKEPAREVCETTCGFFETCRLYDTDVTGLLTDPAHLAAVEMDREGALMMKEGKKLKEEAAANLQGVTGSTGSYFVRWTHVNPTEVSYTRKGYDRLSITKMK